MIIVATTLPDSVASARTLLAIIVLLVVLGVALVMTAIWVVRATRPDEELLAPLELMGERKWRQADAVKQRRQLDAVRPDDAEPLTRTADPPDLDAAFDDGPTAIGFDDIAVTTLSAPSGPRFDKTPPEGYASPDLIENRHHRGVSASVNVMATLDIDAMLERFRNRAVAVKQRPLPPVAGEERQEFIKQAKIDYQDYAIIGDAEASLEEGILTLKVDLRPSDS